MCAHFPADSFLAHVHITHKPHLAQNSDEHIVLICETSPPFLESITFGGNDRLGGAATRLPIIIVPVVPLSGASQTLSLEDFSSFPKVTWYSVCLN